MNHGKPRLHYFNRIAYYKAAERPDYSIELRIVNRIKGSMKRLNSDNVLLSEGNITKSDSFISVKYIVRSNGAKLFYSDVFLSR